MPPKQSQRPGGVDALLDALAAPFVPVRVIKGRWRGMGLAGAYGVHVYGLLLGPVGMLLVGAVFRYNDTPIDALLRPLGRVGPDEMLPTIAGYLFGIIVFVALVIVTAWVLMPWGASPEPWRRSMNRGLIRLLQLTPFHALSIVALVFFTVLIDENRKEWYYYNAQQTPEQPGMSWEMALFLTALCWLTYLASQVVVTLWAVTVHRDRPTWPAHGPWPAVCEGCGYPLVGLGAGQACPECGMAVAASMDTPRARPDRRHTCAKMWHATRRPYTFGKTLPLHRPDPGHRKALWVGGAMLLATPVVGVAILLLITATALSSDWDRPTFDDLADAYGNILTAYTTLAGLTVIGSLGVGLLGAALWGAWARAIRGRNALYPAAQALGYQSGFFTLWALGYYPIAAAFIILLDRYWYGQTPPWVQLLPLVFPAYTLIMAVTMLTLMGRLLAGARFGNA